MARPFRKRTRRPGSTASLPAEASAKPEASVKTTIIRYGESYCEERELEGGVCESAKEAGVITWIDVDGTHQADILEKLAARFGLHPLVVEDIQSTSQRPKLDDYGDYLYIVLRMFYHNHEPDTVHAEQVSIVLGRDFVLSFQEGDRDVFDPVRERIRGGKGRIRKLGADYLAYALVDAIVDSYFAVLERIGDKIDFLEEELVNDPRPEKLGFMHTMKREMIFLRSSVWPLREVIGALQRGESPLVQSYTRVYLRDVYDHTIQVIETLETYRDMLSGMLDIYLSSVSNRLNEVMKVLTIISTVFMPLSVITGFYGMNFRYIPWLEWRWGFLAILLFMLALAGGMLYYFHTRKWF